MGWFLDGYQCVLEAFGWLPLIPSGFQIIAVVGGYMMPSPVRQCSAQWLPTSSNLPPVDSRSWNIHAPGKARRDTTETGAALGMWGQFAHRVRYLNSFSRKWSTFEALVHTVPWWRLLEEELWQGVRAPLGEPTCKQCSNRLKEDKVQACQQGNIYKGHGTSKKKHAQRLWAPTGHSSL